MTVLAGVAREGCAWIARLAKANLLFLAFTLAGLGVLGLFPAYVAMYDLVRGWLHRPASREERALPRFAEVFRAELVRANVLGYCVTAVAAVIWLSMRANGGPAALGAAGAAAALMAGVMLLLVSLHLPFFLVHVEGTWWQLVRGSFLFGVLRPVTTVLVLLAGGAASWAMTQYPGLLVFFGASAVCLCTVWLDLRASRPLLRTAQSVTAGAITTRTPRSSNRATTSGSAEGSVTSDHGVGSLAQ